MSSIAYLPPGWGKSTLEEVTKVIRGITFPSSAKSKSSEPATVVCLRTSNVQRSLEFDDVLHVPEKYVKRDEQWLQDGDTVISMANSYELVGKVALAIQPPPRTTIGGFISIIRPQLLDPRFMYYQLASTRIQEDLRKTASHTVNISNLSLRAIHPTSLVVAPLPEQHRIVEAIESYLTRLDDTVATLERVQRNLKRYRASVLKATVEGRLVPTEAELARAEGRDYERASVLLERILAERRRRWEEAELVKMRANGKVPKDDKWKAKYQEPAAPDTSRLSRVPDGWCWATVDQLLAQPLSNGRSVKTASIGFPVLRLTSLREGFIDLGERKIGAWTAQDAEPFLAQEGDFLVSRGNGSIRLVGIGGLVRSLPEPVAYPDTMIRFRLCDGVAPGFFARVWNSRAVRDQLEVRAKTTAGIFKVNQGDLETCVIPLPPRAEQVRIQAAIERLISEGEAAAVASVRSRSRLSRLRQSILKWAFEGRLVDQNPADEPASVLLERIKAERDAKPARSSRSQRPASRTNKVRK